MIIPEKAFELAKLGGYDDLTSHSFWEMHALKAKFWQCLGTALWLEIANDDRMKAEVEFTAHRFFDLILTGGDTAAFWEGLIK